MLVYNGHSINWADIEIPEQYRVYIEIDPNCRGLIKDTSKWTPPMLSGNYPQEASNAVAVIGKNVEKATYRDAEGNQWISYIGEEFRVTGIVGAEYASALATVFRIKLHNSMESGATAGKEIENCRIKI